MNRRILAFVAFLVAALSIANTVRAEGRPIGIDDLILVREPSQVALSPDGRAVAYILKTPSLQNNGYVRDLYLVAADGESRPRKLVSGESQSGDLISLLEQAPMWAPDSRRLLFVCQTQDGAELRTFDTASGESQVLLTQKQLGDGYELKPSPYGATFAFSPDGMWLAFLAKHELVKPEADRLNRAIDADVDWAPAGKRYKKAIYQLFLLDLANRAVIRLTDDRYSVSGFDWSPDGTRLALSLETDLTRLASYMTTDLFVLDLADQELHPLVSQEGMESDPKWSMDGKWIAFGTQRGTEDWMYGTTLAVVAADGSSAPRLIGRSGLDRVTGGRSVPMRWGHDGSYIDVRNLQDLGRHLFRISVVNGAFERITPRADRTYTDISYSADGRRVAFIAQGVGVPPEVFVSGSERIESRKLTDINPQLRDLSVPMADRVRWRSSDGKWRLNGLLIKPSGYVPGRSYPTLVNVLGGPMMIEQTFNPVLNYPLLVLAERGYVVFMPNTRGREGYGMRFSHAIRDEHSYVDRPLSDVLSGLDFLVRQGVADPERLGILGFSYGGTLAANAVVRTQRFDAAIYGEGHPNLLDAFMNYGSAEELGLARDMFGLGNPFEPAAIRSAYTQSAIYRASDVRTPVLLESGERSAWEGDRQFFRALRHFGVPSEWYVYPRSGHGWVEPVLKQDAFRRHIAWLDYWLLGKRYPDQKKQARYDAWKEAEGKHSE